MKIEWKADTRQYANGEDGYLGTVIIFTYCWNIVKGHGKDKDWNLNCMLPGMKDNFGNYTKEELKIKAEKVLEHWLNIINLRHKFKRGN